MANTRHLQCLVAVRVRYDPLILICVCGRVDDGTGLLIQHGEILNVGSNPSGRANLVRDFSNQIYKEEWKDE